MPAIPWIPSVPNSWRGITAGPSGRRAVKNDRLAQGGESPQPNPSSKNGRCELRPGRPIENRPQAESPLHSFVPGGPTFPLLRVPLFEGERVLNLCKGIQAHLRIADIQLDANFRFSSGIALID